MGKPVPKDDPMVRDGKRLPEQGTRAIKPFLISVGVVLPLYFVAILPTTILCVLWKKIFGGAKKPAEKVESAAAAPVNMNGKRIIPLAERDLDVVFFGATGFTGKMAAKYVAKTYGTSIKWAIAGRRKEGLEKVRDELCQINSALKDLPLILADTSKPETLHDLVSNTRVVATTVGPFAKYGSPLVQYCANYGTSYCDITGESDWVREMIDRYDEKAKETGAKIVSFCGHDCVPWDLAVLEVAKKFSKDYPNETLAEVHCYDEIRGSASGGTIATIFHSLENRVKYKSQLGFDPFLKDAQGNKSEAKVIPNNQTFVGYSSENGTWVGPFVMAMVMANCIRRSNAYVKYSPKLVYREAMVFPNFMAAATTMIGYVVFGTSLFNPPLTWLLKNYVLPSPGEGPSEEAMDKGFLKLTVNGHGSGGSQTNAMMYFPTDPGYRDTARMLAESALSIALEGDNMPNGVLTPAACQADVLLRRLEKTGTMFEFQ